eukprot:SAG31_NODE_1786_length_7271_cov_6.872492_5_plen_63_part_00
MFCLLRKTADPPVELATKTVQMCCCQSQFFRFPATGWPIVSDSVLHLPIQSRLLPACAQPHR